MNQTLRKMVCVVSVLLIASCSGSPYRNTEQGERLSGRYISFETPGVEWEISKEYETAIYKPTGKEPSLRRDNFIDVVRYVPGGTISIRVSFLRYRGIRVEGFFDKDSKYETVFRDQDMVFNKVDKEQGVNYKRSWVAYVDSMKCHGMVVSQGYGGVMASVSNKHYNLLCGYYDKEEGKRLLLISYRYNYAAGDIRMQHDKDTPKSELLTKSQVETILKEAVKRVVDSIEIKRLDRERMEREGLMHYDKQFEISPF